MGMMKARCPRHWLLATVCIITLSDGAFAQDTRVSKLERLCGSQEHALVIDHALAARVPPTMTTQPQTDSQTLRELATKLRGRADYDMALKAAYTALDADVKMGAQADQLVGHDLAEIGMIHRWQSDSEARPALLCTLNIRRQLPEGDKHPSTASALVELANFEMIFQRWTEADAYLTQAIGVLRAASTDWSSHLAAALITQGNLRSTYPANLSSDERVMARRSLYEEALHINRKLPGCKGACEQVAISMDAVARSWNEGSPSVRSSQKATAYASEALAMKLGLWGPAHDSTATTYQTLAEIAVADSLPAKALVWYRQASWTLQVAAASVSGPRPAILSRLAEVSAELAMYAQAMRTPDETTEAILQYTVSVDARQKMRAGAEGLPENYRRDLTRAIAEPYVQLATLLLDAGRIPESEAVIDLLKEEELANFLRGGGGATKRAAYNQPPVARMAEIARQSIDKSAERLLLERMEPSALTPAQSARLAELRSISQQQIDDYQRFIASLSKGANQQQSNADAVSRLQKRIRRDPNGAAGVRYILAGQRVGIVVVLRDQAFAKFSDVSDATLTRRIKALREAIQARADTKPASRELWNALIEPIIPILQQAQVKTLVMSLTGPLRYAPFAALMDSQGTYLIERYALANWPDAADGEPAPQSVPWTIAAMGLTKSWGRWDPLPTVESELQAIVKHDAESTGVIPGQAWGSAEFSRERFEASLKGSANVIHVATHFELKYGDERSSQLVLGIPNQLLSLRDMRILDFDHVSLLTLSACQTALGGGINENGVEVEGLASAVLRQGAKSVVASLWKVSDASTSFLMKQFYAGLVATSPLDKASALRAAQLEVMKQSRSAPTSSLPSVDGAPSPLWAHPFYWAPFVLSGQWR